MYICIKKKTLNVFNEKFHNIRFFNYQIHLNASIFLNGFLGITWHLFAILSVYQSKNNCLSYSVCMIFFNYYVNFGSVSLLQWTKIGKNSAINDEIIGAVGTFISVHGHWHSVSTRTILTLCQYGPHSKLIFQEHYHSQRHSRIIHFWRIFCEFLKKNPNFMKFL